MSSRFSLRSLERPRKTPSGSSSIRLSATLSTSRLSNPASRSAGSSASWFCRRNSASRRARFANAPAGTSDSSLIATDSSPSSGRFEKTPGGSSVSWLSASHSRFRSGRPAKASAGNSPIRFRSSASHSRLSSSEKMPGGTAPIWLLASISRLSDFRPEKDTGRQHLDAIAEKEEFLKVGEGRKCSRRQTRDPVLLQVEPGEFGTRRQATPRATRQARCSPPATRRAPAGPSAGRSVNRLLFNHTTCRFSSLEIVAGISASRLSSSSSDESPPSPENTPSGSSARRLDDRARTSRSPRSENTPSGSSPIRFWIRANWRRPRRPAKTSAGSVASCVPRTTTTVTLSSPAKSPDFRAVRAPLPAACEAGSGTLGAAVGSDPHSVDSSQGQLAATSGEFQESASQSSAGDRCGSGKPNSVLWKDGIETTRTLARCSVVTWAHCASSTWDRIAA